ncbi:MAG: HAD family hydrolase [Clostridiales bacterium]|nr:HAD family hydrolase [Clostridiales bacterium]
MKYKAIIFDVGDTLIHFVPSWDEMYRNRLKQVGVNINRIPPLCIQKQLHITIGIQVQKETNGAPFMKEKEYNRLMDESALSCAAKLMEDENILLDRLQEIPLQNQEKIVIDGVNILLDTLCKRYRLAIVSNFDTTLLDFLKDSGLAQYFETIIVSDIVGVSKPDQKIMQLALDDLKLSASECLYVGDHALDVLCAKEAGLDIAWITDRDSILPDTIPYKEDYRISSVLDLLTQSII